MSEACPCGSSRSYEECCGPFHEGAESPTAEALMRSRYSAFAKKRFEYLHRTTDPQTRARFDRAANEEWARTADFVALEILASAENGNRGEVEFKATYVVEGKTLVHHERSRFRREGDRWYFREGRSLGQGG